MQIIIISPNKATHKHWTLTLKQLMLLSIVLFTLFASAVYYVSQKISPTPSALHLSQSAVSQDLLETSQKKNDETIVKEVPEFYAKRLGYLQAEAIRLKAITEQIANMAGFDLSQYALDTPPAQGGSQQQGTLLNESGFRIELSQLSNNFDEQLHQLELIQTYVVTDNAIASTIPSRKPINGGWLSSPYGERIDPFNGKTTFHHGLDFAAREGDEIYAVADGIVSWMGNKSGYGKTIEIDHGNGYVTRYAHSKELLVSVGDRITKDQRIALMGSTGRSTGPHVHFEVLLAGRTINPYKFIKN